jgi:hypothetical protein
MIRLLKRKSFWVALAVGAFIAAAVALLQRNSGSTGLRLACDGCFVAGILVGGAGCLMLAAGEGMFDVFGYGISFVLNLHWSGIFHKPEELRRESYADYKVRKSASRSSPGGVLLAGGIYLLLAAILLVIYFV